MANEVKRKRGRPRKIVVDPIVDEHSTERLEMAQKPAKDVKVTVEDIAQATASVFSAAIKKQIDNNKQRNINDFQQYNPFIQNQRLKMINMLPTHVDKDDIITALRNPQNHEDSLRGSAWELSSVQYLYYRILREAADIPLFNPLFSP